MALLFAPFFLDILNAGYLDLPPIFEMLANIEESCRYIPQGNEACLLALEASTALVYLNPAPNQLIVVPNLPAVVYPQNPQISDRIGMPEQPNSEFSRNNTIYTVSTHL